MSYTKKYSLGITAKDSTFESVQVKSSKDSADAIRKYYFDDIQIFESFFILLLDRANNTIGYAKISQGGVSGTVVDTRIIAKYAVDTLASAVILAHNHPSGNLKPSTQDIAITKKAKEGLKLLDVQVLDHIILTSEGYLSMADEYLM